MPLVLGNHGHNHHVWDAVEFGTPDGVQVAVDLSSTAVRSKTFTKRSEGYDVTEVETFLHALATRIGELEAQVASATTGSAGSKDKLRADAERLARIADVELAAGGRASFDSRITLDALQDAQADIVARVESTAKDLHDSIERDGRVSSSRTNWRPTPSTTTSAATSSSAGTPASASAAPTSAATTPTPAADPVSAVSQPAVEPATPATPAASSPSAAQASAPAPAAEAKQSAQTQQPTPAPQEAPPSQAPPAAAAPTTPTPATPVAASTPSSEKDLASMLAELDEDPLGDASNALDGVLDDVMGTLRPKD